MSTGGCGPSKGHRASRGAAKRPLGAGAITALILATVLPILSGATVATSGSSARPRGVRIETYFVAEAIGPNGTEAAVAVIPGPVSKVASQTGGGAGFIGEGFEVRKEGLALGSGYVLRPVNDNSGYTNLLSPIDALASELVGLTGVDFSRGSVRTGHTSTKGEISIGVLTPLPVPGCDLTIFIGCGGVAILTDFEGNSTVDHGWVSLAPRALEDPRLLRAVLGHETGHALGLGHWDTNFGGQIQLMHTTLADPTLETYRDGDIRGLRYVAGNGLGDPSLLPPLPPSAPSVLTIEPGAELVKLGWKVADNGSDLISHEVLLESTNAQGSTTTQHKTGASRGVTITGLEAGTVVRYKVRAENGDGFGPWSAFSAKGSISCKGPFTDIPDGHPFCPDIDWAVDSAIAEGFDDGTFKPTAPVTRQGMAAFLRRTVELLSPGSTAGPWPEAGFADVPASNPFAQDIDWLTAAEITTGYDDGTFRPTAPVTRQAMAAFLRRTSNL